MPRNDCVRELHDHEQRVQGQYVYGQRVHGRCVRRGQHDRVKRWLRGPRHRVSRGRRVQPRGVGRERLHEQLRGQLHERFCGSEERVDAVVISVHGKRKQKHHCNQIRYCETSIYFPFTQKEMALS